MPGLSNPKRQGLGRTLAALFAPAAAVLALVLAFPAGSGAARIKDITFVEGVRSNQLVGYGLVVGLDGTGDGTSAVYTTQSIANMLNRMGMKFDPDDIRVKNTAAVMITAELPPFVKPGTRIDVLASSLGDASSLMGGTLIRTPLKGPDGRVYAVAQGHIALAGFTAGGASSKVSKNHQTAGRIPGGAIIEQEVPVSLYGADNISLSLRSPDFTTARRVATAINERFSSFEDGADALARPVDPGSVSVTIPEDFRKQGVVEFVSRLEALDITPDSVTRVVVNERTGTVVMGEDVKISTVAISHGDITIEIKTQYLISQPQPFSNQGETVVQPVESTKVREKKSRLIVLPESTTLGEVVRALNLVGVTPRDLVAILQAIKAAGALHAELEVI